MVSETGEWSIPTPARALLWWPAVSFALVVVDPDAATGVIIGAGLVLALLGVTLPVVARLLRRPATTGDPSPLSFSAAEFPTTEFALEAPIVADERAA